MTDQISKDWLKSELDTLSKKVDDRYDALSKKIDDKHDAFSKQIDDKHDAHARETNALVNSLHKRLEDTQSANSREMAAHVNGLHKRIEDAQHTNNIILAVATIIIILAMAFFTNIAPNGRGQNPAHNTDLNKLDAVTEDLTKN